MTEKILSSFLRGLLLVAPTAVTIYVLIAALRFVDTLIEIDIPGLGILIIISGITVIGALSQTLLFDPLWRQMEKLINRVPLAALIYSSVKDLLSAFVGDKRKFDSPVLAEIIPGSGILSLGFITQNQLEEKFGKEKVAVYFPDSYNISGKVMIVDLHRLQKLDMKSADAMKFVVSGGVAYHSKSQAQAEDQNKGQN
jgi:uncharacterized membrane protein